MSYRTVMQIGTGRYEEKKSVFYAVCAPVTNEEDALAVLAEEKKRYPDARHHVYAYLLSDGNLLRYSDDSEPKGTAGMPILDLCRKRELTDLVLVVTRYFGGTLLGTGGLVRAYTAAAEAALTAAVPAEGRDVLFLSYDLSYSDYERAAAFAARSGATVTDTDFGTTVLMSLQIAAEEYPAFSAAFSEAFGGRYTPEIRKKDRILVPLAESSRNK